MSDHTSSDHGTTETETHMSRHSIRVGTSGTSSTSSWLDGTSPVSLEEVVKGSKDSRCCCR